MAIHNPAKGVITFSFADFSPVVLKKKKNINKKIAITMGVPNPPLRMMEPSGAPIRKSTRHASDRVIFLCHSILCKRRSLCFDLYSELAISLFNATELIMVAAFCSTEKRRLSGTSSSNFLIFFDFEISGLVYPLSTVLANAKIEMMRKDDFDYNIINDDLDRAFKELETVVESIFKGKF